MSIQNKAAFNTCEFLFSQLLFRSRNSKDTSPSRVKTNYRKSLKSNESKSMNGSQDGHVKLWRSTRPPEFNIQISSRKTLDSTPPVQV